MIHRYYKLSSLARYGFLSSTCGRIEIGDGGGEGGRWDDREVWMLDRRASEVL